MTYRELIVTYTNGYRAVENVYEDSEVGRKLAGYAAFAYLRRAGVESVYVSAPTDRIAQCKGKGGQ